ncbi:type II secretion system F family protein [Acidiphilium sp. PA]|uniref:type II secretion system F family protein n=1 Tax=Acidiphilium sp. PA TaxID=2871705 RepID=UPI002243A5BE|nr:type II secretion system F family protein [Acidiphilium sp. PA]MCW8305604.1 type II secretion system F family protein [Acidiphilium sp. PA]
MALLYVGIPAFFLLIAAIAMLMLKVVIEEEKLARRIARAGGLSVAAETEADRQPVHIRIIVGLGFAVARSGLLSAKTLADLRHTLRMAGIRDQGALGLFVGAKLLMFAGLPAIAFASLHFIHLSQIPKIGLIGAAAIAGLLGPDMIIQQRRKRFVKRVEAGLADALDLMVICADAGLSLEPGLARVANEIRETHPAVAQELTITSNEMRIGNQVRDALTALGTRTGLDSLKRLGSTLIQTIQYGTPLTQALRTLSAELRQEQLTRFEERAARLPVLLTLPMIIFILPCVFLVVGGPAILKVMAAF